MNLFIILSIIIIDRTKKLQSSAYINQRPGLQSISTSLKYQNDYTSNVSIDKSHRRYQLTFEQILINGLHT